MKDFNENPFKKDTPVRPFSNGSEAMEWHDRNCEKCLLYDDEAESEETAKCKLAFHLDYGFVSSEIPIWVAKEIGCDYNPLYGTIKLGNCMEKKTGNEPF